MFDSHFIYTYNSTDRVIRIIDTNGNFINTLNICKYQKSTVLGIYLQVYMEGNLIYTFDFMSNGKALEGITRLKNAINTLKPNCTNTIFIPPTPSLTVPVTYSEFKDLYLANTLVPFTYYSVSDTLSLLNTISYTYLLQPLTINDSNISGKIISDKLEYVKIDLITDKIIYYEDTALSNSIIGGGNLTINDISSISRNCMLLNNSNATISDSINIIVSNNSQINCTGCSNITVNNYSNIPSLTNSSNVTIDGHITFPSTFPYGLTNVEISKSSVGKIGFTKLGDPSIDINLVAYVSTIDNQIKLTTSAMPDILNINLINPINDVKAEFKISISDSSISFIANKIIQIKYGPNLLAIISKINVGNTFVFSYNSTNGFQFDGMLQKNTTSSKTVQFLSPTDGQTNFDLNIPLTLPTELEMYINGIKQTYSIDYYYDSGLGQVVYINTSFPIDSTEIVEFRVF